ncbi:MAG: hypothetical protein WC907_01980 [Acholeplasmataceae bacterium]
MGKLELTAEELSILKRLGMLEQVKSLVEQKRRYRSKVDRSKKPTVPQAPPKTLQHNYTCRLCGSVHTKYFQATDRDGYRQYNQCEVPLPAGTKVELREYAVPKCCKCREVLYKMSQDQLVRLVLKNAK